MIVDCHTHWGRDWQDQYGADPAAWLDILDHHDVTHAVVLPEKGLFHAGKIEENHDEIAAVAARASGRMIPFCTANVWFRDDALRQVTTALGSQGFRGIKFHPWIQGASVSTPVMDEICEIAAEYDVPILFHDGTPPFSLPSQIALLAQRHPNTKIILGHSGLFEHWREAIAAMHSAPNLWGCLCSPHVGAISEIIRQCGTERIVWGSDFGFKTPDIVGYRLRMLDLLGLNASQITEILSENPWRLLKLNHS